MNIKVEDVMVPDVITITPEQLVGKAKKTMNRLGIHCLPVVDDDESPVGILTASDVLTSRADKRTVENYMSRSLYTIPPYADVSQAARMMRNHQIHHLVVTYEQEIVGIVSSFDLLRLLEERRFIMKGAPTPNGKKAGRRGKTEGG